MNGDKIKSLRTENHLTQKQLAENIGVAQSTIGMVESNKREAGKELLIKLANYFNVSIDYLISEESNTNLDTESTNDNKDFNPTLSIKEQENLDKKAEELINELTISLSQNKDHLSDEDYEVLLASMKGALQAMTIRNKKKYTPKKYRNKK